MEKQKIGYIEITFTEDVKQKIIDWSSILKEEDLFTINDDDKVDGGNVTNKLHLTLFYGFDDKLLNKDEMSNYINNVKLKHISVERVGVFPVVDHNCKILFLKVNDEDKIIKNINDDLKIFPHFLEYQKSQYIPHITIAFVKDTFNHESIVYDQPKILSIEKIEYISKEVDKL